ncbi:MAG TPA: UDP-N-acetylmuramoyl-tripeptide--D-alanyl-D-alanine ligase [Actinomycetota bacterium]|nr:UDP-N-acetylmuramoyl-tripeptide--D-alanyl-D-alanine ligase [Actinomycetota bacterium]
MKPRSLSAVAAAVGGRLQGEDATVTGAAVDSRQVRPGDLFVALPGARNDGHEFVDAAFAAGAAGVVRSRPHDGARPSVIVDDTGEALRALAGHERRNMDGPVVGVTGSTGKTSVKDLIAAVLATRHRVGVSPRSYNTEVGVPLTLLNLSPDTEIAVLEMGSRGKGHIATLCDIARPDFGVVTNVGLAHLEMFGSPEAVGEAKRELVEALPATGTAVLNADDPVVRTFAGHTRARVLQYGTDAAADIRGENLVLDRAGRPSFTLRTPSGTEHVELGVVGEHMAWNALAAAGCGVALGLSAGECAAGLKEARLSPWRMDVFEGRDGVTVVNDAYNANPSSMAAALKAARWMAGDGRCLAVLGEMAELGDVSDREHERIGELIARLGIDALVTVGPRARVIGAGAVREGVDAERVIATDTLDEAVDAVRGAARPGDVVLVKGSRVAGLERVAEALR